MADGRTGQTVASADVESMAAAMIRLASDRGSARAMGREGRAEVERRFSLTAMVATYQAMYDRQLALAGHLTRDH